jgi:hypothetical protein
MATKPEEIAIRSNALEYLTYIAATGDNPQLDYDKTVKTTRDFLAIAPASIFAM